VLGGVRPRAEPAHGAQPPELGLDRAQRGEQRVVAARCDEPAVDLAVLDRRRDGIARGPQAGVRGAQGGAARRVVGRGEPDRERLEERRDGVELADGVLVQVGEQGVGSLLRVEDTAGNLGGLIERFVSRRLSRTSQAPLLASRSKKTTHGAPGRSAAAPADSDAGHPRPTDSRQLIPSTSAATASITSMTGSTRKWKAANVVVRRWMAATSSVSMTA
jgi:hypothetical protein